MSNFMSAERIQHFKDKYPAGTRVELDSMGDDPRPIERGTKGTVIAVDDIGTVHCRFDNGRQLGLVPGEDFFHKIIQEEVQDSGPTLSM